MTTFYADLHAHTTCSDGILSPTQLVEKAVQTGFKALAITDHDTMEAHRMLGKSDSTQPLRIIPGIELSCQEHGREIHILGYFLDPFNDKLCEHERQSREDRDRRAEKMVTQLRKAGVSITKEEVDVEASGAPIGRPHLAAILIRKGFATSMQDAFAKWLERGRIGYAEREKFTISDAVHLIRTAGGVSFVAHPGRTFQDPRLFLALIALGIDGLEVYHPSHWNVTREYYRLLAKQHNLLVSGGSDYHGSRSYDEQNFGTFGVTEEMLDVIHTKAIQYRSQYS